MFEQEAEMEQRQASVVPLLLIVAMILTFVGVAAYYVVQNGKVLSSAESQPLDCGFAEEYRPGYDPVLRRLNHPKRPGQATRPELPAA